MNENNSTPTTVEIPVNPSDTTSPTEVAVQTEVDPLAVTFKVPKPGMVWNPLLNYPANIKCFCGSKVKFKKCCKRNLAPAITPEDAAKVSELARAVKKAWNAK